MNDTLIAPVPENLPASVILQAAKLGDIPPILAEFASAERRLAQDVRLGRIYGLSGGSLVALALALALSARRDPAHWGRAAAALQEFAALIRSAQSRDIRRLNRNPLYGLYNLDPLRRWVAGRLRAYCGREDVWLSELSVPLYLCAMDWDGVFTLFGLPDESLQFQYHHVRVGPPMDAPVLDALTAALSTMLSTSPVQVHTGGERDGEWFWDVRPAFVDAGALVADLEAGDPRPIFRTRPHAPVRHWKLNWFTSSFIMHSKGEQNHVLTAAYYLDLLARHRALQQAYQELQTRTTRHVEPAELPHLRHFDLPYVGSTEAGTNMRQTVENLEPLRARFQELLAGQTGDLPFDRPVNVIYGAGGSSGILAGLVAARAMEARFRQEKGEIRQIYGVSAGVLDGFFHAVQVAAARHPDLYTPAARHALDDLDTFISQLNPRRLLRFNWNPFRLWQGWTNLDPLRAFLLARLADYTGSRHPEAITFDDIGLPLTISVSRPDGFIDLLGMTGPDRRLRFGGRELTVRPAPVVQGVIAGWSMNTYIEATRLGDQVYVDGGGSFYDPALFPACMDPELIDLLSIHLADPEGHSYNLPRHPNLVGMVIDTHNYMFPEQRRRMRALSDLLYEHYRLRARYAALLETNPAQAADVPPLPPDFRREWDVDNWNLEGAS